MVSMVRRPCTHVRVAVRRVQRHPVTRRTGRIIQKHVVRGVTLGLIPDALNDFAFHHAPVTVNEAVHILQDQVTVSSISAVIALAMLVTKTEKML